jgi:uroporphyrin-3 C-methyltransferase
MSSDNIPTDNQEIKKKNKMPFVFFILLILFLLGGLGYGYYQLSKINLSLAKMLSVVKKETDQQQTEIISLKQSLSQIQESVKAVETASKQENTLEKWKEVQKNDLNKWYVAQAKYLVNLAKDHSELAHDNAFALILMQRAMQILQQLPSDARLLDLQKSLQDRITKAQTATTTDITQWYTALNELQTQVNQLPLPATPLSQTNQKKIEFDLSALPWWKAGFYYSLQHLQKIVIVQYNPDRVLPLVLPEEKHFLYQNLHSILEDAMWGALHHNESVYKTSLNRAKTWISTYFDQNAIATQTILKKIQELESVLWQTPDFDFNAVLQLFDNYFSDSAQENTP